MPEPRAMNIAVFMDEVMPIYGPLMLVPRSHKHGVLPAGHDEETTSYPLWTLDNETVIRLVGEGGIVAPTGRPGSVLMFHGNLVHGSAPNITPYPRRIVYLTLCAVSNYIRNPTRPVWIAHRDFTPIEPVAERSLSVTSVRCLGSEDPEHRHPVVIGGDIHSFWANDPKVDFDDPQPPSSLPNLWAPRTSQAQRSVWALITLGPRVCGPAAGGREIRTRGPRLDRRNLSGEACVQLTTTVQEADHGS
jgi:hypothetical protein